MSFFPHLTVSWNILNNEEYIKCCCMIHYEMVYYSSEKPESLKCFWLNWLLYNLNELSCFFKSNAEDIYTQALPVTELYLQLL